MRFKPGVKVAGIRPELTLALQVAAEVYMVLGAGEMTVTSVVDGAHSNTSLHYSGAAADLRTNDLPTDVDRVRLADTIDGNLTDEYDVIYEADGQNSHIHLEYQPKRGDR